MRTIEQVMDTRELRRSRADDKAYTKLVKQMDAAELLIGELMREGKTVYYINRGGRKNYREGTKSELIDFLISNKYV